MGSWATKDDMSCWIERRLESLYDYLSQGAEKLMVQVQWIKTVHSDLEALWYPFPFFWPHPTQKRGALIIIRLPGYQGDQVLQWTDPARQHLNDEDTVLVQCHSISVRDPFYFLGYGLSYI